jgi:hypothetical protein
MPENNDIKPSEFWIKKPPPESWVTPNWSRPTVAPPITQSRGDSFIEAATSVTIGLAVAMEANTLVIPLVMGVDITGAQNLELGSFFTALSLVRSYVIRRCFNGKSVWRAIKESW